MSATVTWSVPTMERRLSDGFVTTAHWRCVGVDGEFTADVYATTSWAPAHPTVPYADLQPEQVLGWIWASGVDKAATEAAVQGKLGALKNPTTATGVPWSA